METVATIVVTAQLARALNAIVTTANHPGLTAFDLVIAMAKYLLENIGCTCRHFHDLDFNGREV